MANNICNICFSILLSHSKFIDCYNCHSRCHLKCITLNKDEQNYFIQLNEWLCLECVRDMFPFTDIGDDEVLNECITKDPFVVHKDSVFIPFELNEDNRELLIYDSDPDFNFYQDINHILTSKCNYYLEDSFNHEIHKSSLISSNCISICHLNIRSAKKNLNQFESYLSLLEHNFTVIGLSETWLDEDNCDLFNMNGYTFESVCRKERTGGGVAICVKEGISYVVRKDLCLSDDMIECIFIEITNESIGINHNVVVAVIYRPPNTDMKIFNEKVIYLLDVLKKEKKICYLSGDFNIDCFKSEKHKGTADFLDIMYSHSYIPMITRPTRVTTKSASLIDNIYTNNLQGIQNTLSGLLTTDITDHFAIFHVLRTLKDKESDLFFWKRCLNTENKRKFSELISNERWIETLNNEEAQLSFTAFQAKLKNIYDSAFPKIKVKMRYSNRKPWLSDELREEIKKKNKLFAKSKRYPSAFNESLYTDYRNKVTRALRKAEKNHFNNLIEINKNNIKKTWNVIKTIINKNKVNNIQTNFKLSNGLITSDKYIISEKFNDFFINVGPNLAKTLKNTNKTVNFYLKRPLTYNLFLNPVDESEIQNIFKTLKNAAPGYDEIKMEPLKLVLEYIIVPLCHVCNLSLSQGIFPDELKIANVIPLHKKDDSMQFSNYRPVSLLCSLSKVFEKIMYNRLVAFLETYKILYEYQFGFRKSHSTYLAIMSLLDRIIKCLENGDCVIGVFLDFSKAFDTVDHSILLQKLYHYGVRGVALQWFQSYLSDRQQYVTYNGVSSNMKKIKCGVPQGSILGPLLFLIYINDLADICKNVFSIFFADDSNIFKNGKDLHILQATINSELSAISEWLNVNKLFMNVSKTQYMVFSRKKFRDCQINLNIDQKSLTQVHKSKFLGIVIDDQLTFKDHIAHVSSKVAKGIGIICKARNVLNKDSLLSLYYAFIYPHLSYCNQIWGNIPITTLNKLVVLQKRAVRIICGVHPRTHTGPLFEELKILNMQKMNRYLVGQMMYRYHRGELPDVFSSFFTYNRSVHRYGTRQSNHMHLPKFKTGLGIRSLAYWGAKIWNCIIISDIPLDVSPLTFKVYLRKSLLNDVIQVSSS